jgi:hypothetical protein
MIIEKSEATGPVEEKQSKFRSGERVQWEIVKRWHNRYFDAGMLDDEFRDLGRVPDDMQVSVKFADAKEVVTEKEKLENLKARKELGLNTKVELILIDRPDMTEIEARAKLEQIQAEAAQAAERVIDERGENPETGQGPGPSVGDNRGPEGEP